MKRVSALVRQAWAGPAAVAGSFASVEGAAPCSRGLLDGPAALAAALLSFSSQSRISAAVMKVL
jgi:hypothetical protein